jgi:hypothetical protein
MYCTVNGKLCGRKRSWPVLIEQFLNLPRAPETAVSIVGVRVYNGVPSAHGGVQLTGSRQSVAAGCKPRHSAVHSDTPRISALLTFRKVRRQSVLGLHVASCTVRARKRE